MCYVTHETFLKIVGIQVNATKLGSCKDLFSYEESIDRKEKTIPNQES